VEVNAYDDLIAEYNATGVLQARYIHGPGIDEPLATVQTGMTKYYLRDALGSIAGLASGQSLTAVYHYEAFGEARVLSGTIDHYGFTSRELDSSSSLYLLRARWYDSEVGRFISKTPMTFAEKSGPYVYVDDNPINVVDPEGLPGHPIINGVGRPGPIPGVTPAPPDCRKFSITCKQCDDFTCFSSTLYGYEWDSSCNWFSCRLIRTRCTFWGFTCAPVSGSWPSQNVCWAASHGSPPPCNDCPPSC